MEIIPLYVFGRDGSQKWAIFPIIAISIVFPFVPSVIAAFGKVLDIGMDVVNYFMPSVTIKNQMVAPLGSSMVVREKIQNRLANLLDHLKDENTELVIVAHSQGTIIALDCLVGENSNKYRTGFKQISLLTCGSPLTHLYQEYFPATYRDDPKWIPLFEGSILNKWSNLFRHDDYVGTEIFAPNKLNSKAVSNQSIGIGGHTGYFKESAMGKETLLLLNLSA